MRLQARGPIGLGPLGWWSPDPRGIIPLDALHVSRSLRRSERRFEIRVDTAFEDVMRGCADPKRPHGWIDKKFVAAISDEPAALVRKDKRYKELERDAADYTTRDEVIAVLLEHPELMERPAGV